MVENDNPEIDVASILKLHATIGELLWSLLTACESGMYQEADQIMDEILNGDPEIAKIFLTVTVMSMAGALDAFCHVTQIDRAEFVRSLTINTARMGILADEILDQEEG